MSWVSGSALTPWASIPFASARISAARPYPSESHQPSRPPAVEEEPLGTRRVYRLNAAGLLALRDQLDTFWNRALAGYSDTLAATDPAPDKELS